MVGGWVAQLFFVKIPLFASAAQKGGSYRPAKKIEILEKIPAAAQCGQGSRMAEPEPEQAQTPNHASNNPNTLVWLQAVHATMLAQ